MQQYGERAAAAVAEGNIENLLVLLRLLLISRLPAYFDTDRSKLPERINTYTMHVDIAILHVQMYRMALAADSVRKLFGLKRLKACMSARGETEYEKFKAYQQAVIDVHQKLMRMVP